MAESGVCCIWDCFLMWANSLMQTISSSSGAGDSGVRCIGGAMPGWSMLVLVMIELCRDTGRVSRAIGERYPTCGGLNAGVGRPLRLPIYCSLDNEKHLACSISKGGWYCSSGVSHVGGVWSSAMNEVQLELVQERFECSSEELVVAGDAIDGLGK
jgi:hypothetical protein